MSLPELWQFRFSMYPEKARWALDYKAVPHVRRSVLPGPHVLQLVPRFGQKSMPVLRHEGRVIKGSAAVVDYLEGRFPQRPLYPRAADERREALQLQEWLDREVGPAVRRAAFHEWLPHTAYAARRFATGLPSLAQNAYVAAFPVVRAVMRLDMGVTEAGAVAGREITRQALDRLAARSQRTGYLVGSSFSVADLTAASMLMPSCLPDEYPVAIPAPLPEGWRRWLDRWQAHPGVSYVRRMYREHRGRSCAVSE